MNTTQNDQSGLPTQEESKDQNNLIALIKAKSSDPYSDGTPIKLTAEMKDQNGRTIPVKLMAYIKCNQEEQYDNDKGISITVNWKFKL